MVAVSRMAHVGVGSGRVEMWKPLLSEVSIGEAEPKSSVVQSVLLEGVPSRRRCRGVGEANVVLRVRHRSVSAHTTPRTAPRTISRSSLPEPPDPHPPPRGGKGTAVFAASAHTLVTAARKMTFGANHDSSAGVEVKEEKEETLGQLRDRVILASARVSAPGRRAPFMHIKVEDSTSGEDTDGEGGGEEATGREGDGEEEKEEEVDEDEEEEVRARCDPRGAVAQAPPARTGWGAARGDRVAGVGAGEKGHRKGDGGGGSGGGCGDEGGDGGGGGGGSGADSRRQYRLPLRVCAIAAEPPGDDRVSARSSSICSSILVF